MSYLLDTNVVSELAREIPDSRVVAWIRRSHADCFLSAITIGLSLNVKGIELSAGREKAPSALKANCASSSRITAMTGLLRDDEATAIEMGAPFMRKRKEESATFFLEDSLIEATALNYRLTVVTRHEKDFFRVTTADPWRAVV